MRPRQLDALVSEEIFGLEVTESSIDTDRPHTFVMKDDGFMTAAEVPMYSSDDIEAEKVYERIAGDKYLRPPDKTNGFTWECGVMNGHVREVFAESESKAKAICLAALRSKGVRV